MGDLFRELMYAGCLLGAGWVLGFCAAVWSTSKDERRDW